MTSVTLKTIKREAVKKVYSGSPGCRCGCRGKYSTRGIKGFETALSRALYQLENNPDTEWDKDGEWADVRYTTEAGNERVATVYFTE